MTLRDTLALETMKRLIDKGYPLDLVAVRSYGMADEMMNERGKSEMQRLGARDERESNP